MSKRPANIAGWYVLILTTTSQTSLPNHSMLMRSCDIARLWVYYPCERILRKLRQMGSYDGAPFVRTDVTV